MKEKKEPKPAKNSAAKVSRQPRRAKPAAAVPAENPVLRHGSLMIELNPGQVKLFEALALELTLPRFGADEDAEIDLPTQQDAPGFSEFVIHQVQSLGERQAWLEGLWQLS